MTKQNPAYQLIRELGMRPAIARHFLCRSLRKADGSPAMERWEFQQKQPHLLGLPSFQQRSGRPQNKRLDRGFLPTPNPPLPAQKR